MLTSVAQYQTFAGATPPAMEAFLALVIPEVDAAIRRDLNRPVIEKQTGLVDYLEGNGRQALVLTHNPVHSVESIFVDDSGAWGQGPDAFPPPELVEGVDWALRIDNPVQGWSDAGIVVVLNGVWPRRPTRYPGWLAGNMTPGAGNIKVTYTAGLTASTIYPPADLTLAANLVISQVFASRKFGWPNSSENLAEYSYALQTQVQQFLVTGTVPAILARYRRIAFPV